MSVHFPCCFFTFLMTINKIPNQLICNDGFIVTFKHKSAFFLYLFIHCSTVRFLLLEKAATQCFIVPVCNESWWRMPLCWLIWIPVAWLSGYGFSLYPSTGKIMEICPHPSLDESHLMISSEKSATLKRSISRFVTVQQALRHVAEYTKDGRKDRGCIY